MGDFSADSVATKLTSTIAQVATGVSPDVPTGANPETELLDNTPHEPDLQTCNSIVVGSAGITGQLATKQRPAKGKKRKKPKDSTAPRHPLTGYVRYLNDRREAVRSSNPTLPFQEITKILASEWSTLAADKKQQYLEAAKVDQERYAREFNAYRQTDAYKAYAEQNSGKRTKEAQPLKKDKDVEVTHSVPIAMQPSSGAPPPSQNGPAIKNESADMEYSTNCDIPIFTEEFLDHNKSRDAELRQLRKSNTDYEQQNAILSKHIDTMKMAIDKLQTEVGQQEDNVSYLQTHLARLRKTLTDAFSKVNLPGIKDAPTLETIDTFMLSLHTMLVDNSNMDKKLLQMVREIISNLEFMG